MKRTSALLPFLLLIGMLACNLPGVTPPALSVDDQAATIIVATLQESLRHGAVVPATATYSPTPHPDPSATATGLTGTITPTFSPPMLTVLQQTNCRTGPGQDYDIVFTYLPKKKLAILGRYEIENYWLVKSEESPTGECWLWGEYVEVTGSHWVVPSVTPPPTATPAPPVAPSIQKWNFACTAGSMTISIEWSDKSNNESRYRILRDGATVVELPPNSKSYTETILLSTGQSATYFIEAYNVTGTARSAAMNLTC